MTAILRTRGERLCGGFAVLLALLLGSACSHVAIRSRCVLVSLAILRGTGLRRLWLRAGRRVRHLFEKREDGFGGIDGFRR